MTSAGKRNGFVNSVKTNKIPGDITGRKQA
jgi:hypothetical protein